MVKHIRIKKMNEVNDELSTITSKCEQAFTAWIQDRSNTKLLVEYRELLDNREIFINRYKSYFIVK